MTEVWVPMNLQRAILKTKWNLFFSTINLVSNIRWLCALLSSWMKWLELRLQVRAEPGSCFSLNSKVLKLLISDKDSLYSWDLLMNSSTIASDVKAQYLIDCLLILESVLVLRTKLHERLDCIKSCVNQCPSSIHYSNFLLRVMVHAFIPTVRGYVQGWASCKETPP